MWFSSRCSSFLPQFRHAGWIDWRLNTIISSLVILLSSLNWQWLKCHPEWVKLLKSTINNTLATSPKNINPKLSSGTTSQYTKWPEQHVANVMAHSWVKPASGLGSAHAHGAVLLSMARTIPKSCVPFRICPFMWLRKEKTLTEKKSLVAGAVVQHVWLKRMGLILNAAGSVVGFIISTTLYNLSTTG